MFAVHGTFSPIQIIVPLVLLTIALLFWGWMFNDMIRSNDLPASAKENWTFAFIIFNVFTAVVYYSIVYRSRR